MRPKLTIWSVWAAMDPKRSKIIPKLIIWSIWATLGAKCSKMRPKSPFAASGQPFRAVPVEARSTRKDLALQTYRGPSARSGLLSWTYRSPSARPGLLLKRTDSPARSAQESAPLGHQKHGLRTPPFKWPEKFANDTVSICFANVSE